MRKRERNFGFLTVLIKQGFYFATGPVYPGFPARAAMSTALSALLRTKVARVGNTPVDSPTALTAQVDFEVLKVSNSQSLVFDGDRRPSKSQSKSTFGF